MAYRHFSPNPYGRETKDCTARAVAAALGMSWEDAFLSLVFEGFFMGEYPDHNEVMWRYLQRRGFRPRVLYDTCPDCYTVRDFSRDHPRGIYILGTGSHVVALIDGDWWDAWDSGEEIPIIVYERGEQ